MMSSDVNDVAGAASDKMMADPESGVDEDASEMPMATPSCEPQPSLAESPAYGPDSRAITFGRFKLIRRYDGFVQLFDLHADPDEMVDLSAERPELVAELTVLMERELSGIDTSVSDETMEFDDDTLEQLRSLGYID